MPHISIKFYQGRSDATKEDIAKKIAKHVAEDIGCNEKAISVSFQEVRPDEWKEKVADVVLSEEDVRIHSIVVPKLDNK